MKHIITAILLACANSVLATTPAGISLRNTATIAAATPVAGGASYLFNQNFETTTTGYDPPETWVEAGAGTIEAANTATVIAGSQSLQIAMASQAASTYVGFTAQAALYIKFRFRVASTNGGNQVVATIRDGTTVLGTLTLAGASRVMRATATGAGNGTSTDVLPVDTNVYVWFEYIQGTGANAICRVGWATTDTKPSLASTGAKAGVSSGGTSTAAPNRFYLGNTGTGVAECFYDVVQGSGSAF